jgi:hypothetical protein
MLKVQAAVLCLLLQGIVSAQSSWEPAKIGMMTRWGKTVTPGNVWEEYPRPQLVRSDWQSLNGLWEYALLPKTAESPSHYSKNILVPFCVESSLSGIGETVKPENRIWYRRTFDIPQNWSGKRVILNFEAVDWECAVWVNNSYVGSHQGGYDRFSFDITDFLTKSKSQEIKVSVWDPTNFGTQARGKQQMPQQGIWYTPVSGIWQTVWLEAVPAVFIKEVRIIPDYDHHAVSILPMLSEPAKGNYEVVFSLLEGDKQVAQGRGGADKYTTISISQPKSWSPDSPFLYDIKMSLVKGSDTIETVTSYFGMRKISLGDGPYGKELFLNNKPLFHYGTLDQGWWPDGLHTPPSDEAMKYDIQITKEMGFNMIRKHIKVEPDRWYYWCDKLGILVWQDMPSGMVVLPPVDDDKRPDHLQHVSPKGEDLNRRTEEAVQFEWELRRMVDLHYNAPSIVIWVPFNEGWGQYDTCRVAGWLKAYDPTRLVNAVSGWALRPCGDVYDIHTYGEKVEVPPMQPDRATVIGEYGGIGYPIEGRLWNPGMRNWGYQTYHSAEELYNHYVQKFNQIVEMKKKGLSAAVYTQTTDVEGEVNGLLTYDREILKMSPEKLMKMHSVLYVSESQESSDPSGKSDKKEISELLKSHDRAVHIKDGWIRDPYIYLAPDGSYYLTGTTPLAEDERQVTDSHNTGLGAASIVGYKMSLWRSTDLTEWESLGDPYSLEDGIWYQEMQQRFNTTEKSNWRLWTPEFLFCDGRWVIVHTSPSPVNKANLSVTRGKEITGPYENPMGQAIGRRHDPSLFKDEDEQVWLIWGAIGEGEFKIAPLKGDFTCSVEKLFKK